MLGRLRLLLSDDSGNIITNQYEVANIVKNFASHEISVSKIPSDNPGLLFSVALEGTLCSTIPSSSVAGSDGMQGSVPRQLAFALCLPAYFIF